MTKHIDVSISLFRVVVGLQMALGGVALAIVLLRWPLIGAVVMAGLVAGLMLWAIFRIVTSGAQPKPTPARDAVATVDGRQVEEVTVLR